MKKKFHPVENFLYAFNGILIFFKKEVAASILIFFFVLSVIAGIFFKISGTEWMILLSISALVIVLEMINTAIELLVDKISPERNEIAGRIKDLAAGAVLLASVFSVLIGMIVFLPKLIAMFR